MKIKSWDIGNAKGDEYIQLIFRDYKERQLWFDLIACNNYFESKMQFGVDCRLREEAPIPYLAEAKDWWKFTCDCLGILEGVKQTASICIGIAYSNGGEVKFVLEKDHATLTFNGGDDSWANLILEINLGKSDLKRSVGSFLSALKAWKIAPLMFDCDKALDHFRQRLKNSGAAKAGTQKPKSKSGKQMQAGDALANLSSEQLQFLEQQNISLSRVFNASGMSKSEYKIAMSELEMIVAFGVSPCNKAGHTLRTRGGHCAQCNTAALAFVARYDDPAEVYIAYSAQLKLTKIGVATDHQARLRSLNAQGYGGASDWRILFHSKSRRAGRLEFLAQKKLSQHRVIRTFNRSGGPVSCQELFSCKPGLALAAFAEVIKENR